MKTQSSIALQGRLISELAALLVQTADAAGEWEELFYDIRYVDDCALKRLVLRDATSRRIVHVHGEAGETQAKLWQLRNRRGSDKWFGLSILINRSGQCDVKYDYNANCIEAFARDEKAHRPF